MQLEIYVVEQNRTGIIDGAAAGKAADRQDCVSGRADGKRLEKLRSGAADHHANDAVDGEARGSGLAAEPAIAQDGDAVADLKHFGETMGDKDRADAIAPQI